MRVRVRVRGGVRVRVSFVTNASAMLACTRMSLMAVHRWPL